MATDTAQRILDVAERLFARNGIANVSTRAITDEAEVNSAALHYHFRSKEGLIHAIFERRLGPINSTRERLINEAVAASDPPDLTAILCAFIGPTLAIGASEGEQNFKILAARSSMEASRDVRHAVFQFYDSVGKCFVDAVKKACPDLTREDLFWRLACIYGAMLYVRADNGRLQQIMGDDLSMSDPRTAIGHIVPFLVAGLQAPPVVAPETAPVGQSV